MLGTGGVVDGVVIVCEVLVPGAAGNRDCVDILGPWGVEHCVVCWGGSGDSRCVSFRLKRFL